MSSLPCDAHRAALRAAFLGSPPLYGFNCTANCSLSPHVLYLVPLLSCVLAFSSCVSTTQRGLAQRYYNIATDYYDDENYSQAVNYYELALQQDPNFKLAYLNYGLALIELNEYQQAERQLVRARAVDARNTLCLSALGYLDFRAGRYKNAAARYRESIEINPYNPESYYNLGIAEQYLSDYDASQEAFDKIAELQDLKEQPAELRRYAALNQLYLGAPEKADALYKEYLANRGSDKQIFQDVYNFYSQAEEYDKLIETFKLFEESISDSALSSFLLAELYYLKLNNPVLGLENFKHAVDRHFRDDERLQDLVKQLKGNERKAAQELLDQQ